MSIRILGAYRLKPMSVQRLQAWCNRLSDSACHLAERSFASYLAIELCQKLDNHALGFELLADTDPYSVQANVIQNALSDSCPGSGNWDLSLRFIADSRHLYMMSEYHGSNYKALLDSMEGLEPFNYQNSSDTILDGVSEREWAARARTWGRLLNKASIDECGFVSTIVSKHRYCFPSKELLLRMLPGQELRSSVVTIEHEISKRMDELAHQYPNKPAMLYREAKRQILSIDNQDNLRSSIKANAQRIPDIAALLA